MSPALDSETAHLPTSSGAWLSLGIRLTFTQGFLAGQLSVVIVGLIAIRYIIFEDSRSASRQKATARTRASSQVERMKKGRKSASGKDGLSNVAKANIASVMGDIMSKVRYEIDSHAGESIDWLNVIIAQALAGYREDILAGGWSAERKNDEAQKTAREWMEDILNARTLGRGMSFLDPIQVSHVTFGDAYPIFTNARVRPADDTGRMRVEVDIDYSDCISLAIDTKLLINLPRPRFAVLPISLGLTIERFSGTLAVELYSSEDSTFLPTSRLQAPPRSRHEVHLSLHPDFALDATATSLVGSRAKLQDVPKIEQLLVGRLRSYVHDRFVWPKYWSLTLPNLVPKTPTSSQTELQDDLDETVMHVAGQGDVLEEGDRFNEKGSPAVLDRAQNGFFQSPPPLFPQTPNQPLRSHHPLPPSSLPGSMPTVEAWRSQAAATGVNHRSRSSLDPRIRPDINSAYPNETRHRSGGGVTSSAAY